MFLSKIASTSVELCTKDTPRCKNLRSRPDFALGSWTLCVMAFLLRPSNFVSMSGKVVIKAAGKDNNDGGENG